MTEPGCSSRGESNLGHRIPLRACSMDRPTKRKSAADLQKLVCKPSCHIGADEWEKVTFWLQTSLLKYIEKF